ncbi:MAG TPA: TIGR04283 family arsenosugar biosynthesis glycosyltransferase [Gammaproteobacteria bacterium]|nr:TIGR04283 family arsenosugar biosynthesis glycosyltransferase [Gammaproteobacteria bacterium]
MKISIIVPVLNERERLGKLLDILQKTRSLGHEVVIVDGGSDDGSMDLSSGRVNICVTHPGGRAIQMNAGAALASGDILLFLHADTVLPEHFLSAVLTACNDGRERWGFFQVRLSGEKWLFRIIETCMNLRSRLTSIATGDQCVFVTRQLFQQTGGYEEIPLMEDISLCGKLNAVSRPVILNETVTTSSRRWQQRGIIKTIITMWILRLAYSLGVNPARLARLYYG